MGSRNMGGTEIANATTDGSKKRKAESTPPDGYVCRLCSTPGHWIQVCPTKKTGTKRQRKSDHVPVPGQDPSPEDIEKAREFQKIPPPKCFCGLPSRLNKVKRSKDGGDSSRAIGKYFFFCSKKRFDETQCRFARPVEMELKKQRRIREREVKRGGEKSKQVGDKKKPVENKNTEKSKTKQVCKFFAKNGSCKKGRKCEFSHDVGAKKASVKAQAKKKRVETERIKQKEVGTGSDDSSSDVSSSSDDSSNISAPKKKKTGGSMKEENEEDGTSSGDSNSSSSSSSDDSSSGDESN